MAQLLGMVSPAAHTSGLMMCNVVGQRSVSMTAVIVVGGLKTVGLQTQLKSYVQVQY